MFISLFFEVFFYAAWPIFYVFWRYFYSEYFFFLFSLSNYIWRQKHTPPLRVKIIGSLSYLYFSSACIVCNRSNDDVLKLLVCSLYKSVYHYSLNLSVVRNRNLNQIHIVDFDKLAEISSVLLNVFHFYFRTNWMTWWQPGIYIRFALQKTRIVHMADLWSCIWFRLHMKLEVTESKWIKIKSMSVKLNASFVKIKFVMKTYGIYVEFTWRKTLFHYQPALIQQLHCTKSWGIYFMKIYSWYNVNVNTMTE